MRFFIAIDVPDDIKKMIGRLRGDIPGASWVQSEQIHLTLAFLGEVEEAAVERVSEKLAGIQLSNFQLCFGGTGCFPDRHRPRILWIGLEPQPQLHALAAKVREAVLACGITQEERPFSPHITLARLKLPSSRASDFDAFLGQHQKQKIPPFSVREFILFQSRLTPQGAVHIPVRSFPLAAETV